MASEGEFSELVGLIYDAALDWQAWPTALTRLADVVGGGPVMFGAHDARTQGFIAEMPRTDPVLFRSYFEHWANRNPASQRTSHLPAGTIMRGYDCITRDDLIRSDYYNEWLQPQEMDWALGAKLIQDGSTTGIVSVYRPWDAGDFSDQQIAFWRAIVPHVQRALQLQLRLAAAEATSASSLEVLNRLHQGVLLVDAGARVVFANRAAEAIFAERDGLRSDAAGLRAATPAATAALRKLIAGCAGEELDGSGGEIALPRGSGRLPLGGLVIPLRATEGCLHVARPAAILFITDPECQRAVRKAGLQRQFGLTPAEAAFVIEILRGEGLQASADRLGVSVTTARTHLAHVFDKTGTRRQAELVRFVLQSQAGACDA